ncbi:MAG: acyl-CoA synthetase, partial [Caldimonas sp.]
MSAVPETPRLGDEEPGAAGTGWKAKAERGSAALIHLIAWLARAVGRPACRLLLYPIVLYFFVTDGTARRASREFLTRAEARPARWSDVFAHIHSFAATLLDRVYMA